MANDFFLFNDKCNVNKSGKRIRWTNYLPIIFIVLQIANVFQLIFTSIKQKEHFNSVNNNKFIISVLFSLIIMGLNIYIMYNMSYYCNALIGFLICCVLTYLSNQVYSLLFPNISDIWAKVYMKQITDSISAIPNEYKGCDCN